MKVGVIGTQKIEIDNLELYIPAETTSMISMEAEGVGMSAFKYAMENGMNFGRCMINPKRLRRRKDREMLCLKRDISIVDKSDFVLAFWNNKSEEAAFVREYCRQTGIELKEIVL